MVDEDKKNEPARNAFSIADAGGDDLTFVDSTEDGDELPKKDQLKKVREDLKVCRAEKEEYLTGWQRAKADYINLQKELEQTRANSSILAKEKMVHNLMPALDSFKMAFSHKESWEKLDVEWKKGIENIYQQFIKGLHKSGIEEIDEFGVPFDPNIHQSVKMEETSDEKKDHTVAEVFQTGYKIGDRVIRPARVVLYEYKE